MSENLPGILVQGTALREAIADGIQTGLARWTEGYGTWRQADPRALAEYLALYVAGKAAEVADAHTARVVQDAESTWESGADAASGFVPPF